MTAPDQTRCLAWLAKQQSSNGSFGGQASASIGPFRAVKRHPTVFFTSLILTCMEMIEGSERVSARAAHYLQSQQSPIASWNYWQRGSALARSHPYPDDLDDTACALLGLTIYDSWLVDGDILARFAKLLIANEVAPGGPYRTWLVQPELYKQWGDIDVAVNANIGGLLARHDVRLPGLVAYFDKLLIANVLHSPYYVGDVPILYFLARWYRGSQRLRLKQLIGNRLKGSATTDSLTLALLISAGCSVGLPTGLLRRAEQRLMDLMEGDHWPAEALYVDPVIDGTQYYAGSAALTTAFALEALAKFEQHTQQKPVKIRAATPVNATVAHALAEAHNLPAGLRTAYRRAVTTIGNQDSQQQITAMASLTAAAYGEHLKQELLEHLNLASLDGWIAYSIYDDFLDNEGQPDELAIANHALRQTTHHYHAALPKHTGFQNLVSQTLDTIDAANHWEARRARGRIDQEQLHYELPSYGRYAQLADKSLGHMLSACGTLLAAGYTLDSSQLRQLQRFFRHFLIARQLNDDAHDWETDLRHGHLSAVVSLLLSDYSPRGPIDILGEQSALRQHFWQVTIEKVGALITAHIDTARRALTQSGMRNDTVFVGWLKALQTASEQAVTGSQETKKFIHAYQQTGHAATL